MESKAWLCSQTFNMGNPIIKKERKLKMKPHKILTVVLGAALLMTLTGCDRSAPELEKTKADLASSQAELATMKANVAKIEVNLAETIKERDSLKNDLEKANASLSGITEERNQLKTQVDTLTKAKEAAANTTLSSTTTSEQLATQLKEQTQKALTSEAKIKELESLIETLKSQLKGAQGLSIPKP